MATSAHSFRNIASCGAYYLILFGIILGWIPVLKAQSASSSATPQLTLIRFDEDWSRFCDPARKLSGIDALKCVPLSRDRSQAYVSLGGEFRGTWDRVLNDNWSNTPYPTKSFGLERVHFHADFHPSSRARLFIQLESGLTEKEPGGPRSVDEKRLDFLNAFAELRPFEARSAPLVRFGRQEMNFGAGRLVSAREGPNVCQSFYSVQMEQTVAFWKSTGFYSRPAVDNPGFFDDVPQHATGFWGVFSEHTWQHASTRVTDLYYFGIDNKSMQYNRGVGHEVRHTLGARVASNPDEATDTRKVTRHYDLEAAYQFGDFAQFAIRAWTVASETGIEVATLPGRPRLGARIDAASGDSGKGAFGTFNTLFPNGNYFGILQDTGPGPQNFYDLHPEAQFRVSSQVNLSWDCLLLWRQKSTDGVYTGSGTLLVPAGKSSAMFVGSRPGAELHWQATKHAYLQLDYGLFFSGRFLQESGRPQNLNYAATWLGYRF